MGLVTSAVNSWSRLKPRRECLYDDRNNVVLDAPHAVLGKIQQLDVYSVSLIDFPKKVLDKLLCLCI